MNHNSAKEKAKKLVDKFVGVLGKDTATKYHEYLHMENAKERAILCVDEIIAVLDMIEFSERGTVTGIKGQSDYNKIKEEIKLL